MSEISFAIGNYQVATVRLDPNALRGRETAGVPVLHLPLKLQLLPAGEKRDVEYVMLRLAGTLQNQMLGEFARFEVAPLAATPNPVFFDRHQDAFVTFDRLQVKRFEDARAEGDARFQIMLSCLVWYPAAQRFETPQCFGLLDVVVPRSQWIDGVLTGWNLSKIKLVEIRFPATVAGESLRASYTKVEAAERLFANGQWKQTLVELYAAFEALAKAFGFAKPDQQFFASVLSGLHPVKKESLKRALDGFCDLLHLGRHEPNEAANSFAISPQDARFALIMAHAIFEYISPATRELAAVTSA
jgi:hypothetical protein